MIKVSVCVMTYNQEKYIGQCLESLVTQETDFDFEIIVGDDFSTDGTRDVIQEYQKKYPDIIKPVFRDKNVGITENTKEIYFVANGEYIAHMDGDDYALPGKLQIQADFLDNNPRCTGVFHNINILYPNGNIQHSRFACSNKSIFNLSDTLRGVAVGANSSKMFRTSVLDDLILPDIELLDYYFHVITAEKGYLSFLNSNESYSVYRKGIGITSKSKEKIYNTYAGLFEYFLDRYPEEKLNICIPVVQMIISAIKGRCFISAIRLFKILIRSRCIPLVSWFKYRFEK